MVARNRVVISGTIAGSIERWSCSVDYTPEGGGSVLAPGELQGWAERIATVLDAAETDYPAITALMGANVNATRVDVYGYGPTGPAVASGQAVFAWSGTGTIRVPFSTAVCVSKRTGMSGRSRRGRFFWPALAAQVNSDGTFVRAPELVGDFAELLADMRNIDGVTLAIPVVHSATLNQVMEITSVAVGNVLDSQRNRREDVAENYATATVPS